MKDWTRFLSVALLVLATCFAARGQTADPEDGSASFVPGGTVKLDMAGWVFEPAVNSTGVIGFLASNSGANSWPLSVKRIWFERGADDHWTVWGWTEDNLQNAVSWAKNHVGKEEIFNRSSGLETAVSWPLLSNETAPVEMVKGLFITDPNASYIQSLSNADQVVAWLADVGYPVAKELSEKLVLQTDDGVNVLDLMMNKLRIRAEYSLFGTLASFNSFPDLFCSCKRVNGPWTVVSPLPAWVGPTFVRMQNGQCIYEYRRPNAYVRSYWFSGRTGILCGGCGGGPASVPLPTQTGDIVAYVSVPCTAPGGGTPPAAPPAGTPDSIAPN